MAAHGSRGQRAEGLGGASTKGGAAFNVAVGEGASRERVEGDDIQQDSYWPRLGWRRGRMEEEMV
ncbi:hypothetical protein B0H19DRAFT_1152554, partial [Mycena capillaripes]